MSDSVDVVALATFDQVAPASSERCHWYETAAPPSDVADTLRLALAVAPLTVANAGAVPRMTTGPDALAAAASTTLLAAGSVRAVHVTPSGDVCAVLDDVPENAQNTPAA